MSKRYIIVDEPDAIERECYDYHYFRCAHCEIRVEGNSIGLLIQAFKAFNWQLLELRIDEDDGWTSPELDTYCPTCAARLIREYPQ